MATHSFDSRRAPLLRNSHSESTAVVIHSSCSLRSFGASVPCLSAALYLAAILQRRGPRVHPAKMSPSVSLEVVKASSPLWQLEAKRDRGKGRCRYLLYSSQTDTRDLCLRAKG